MFKYIKYIIKTFFLTSGRCSKMKHFTLKEFLYSRKARELKIDNTPTKKIIANIYKTIDNMEIVREILGNRPLIVSSGYRCLRLNKAVGGSKNSYHMQGLACDFISRDKTPREICNRLLKSNIIFDQLILEKKAGKTWVHISFGNKNRMQFIKTSNI